MMPLYFINDTAEKKALSGINLQQQRGPLRLPVAVFNVTLPASPSKRQITPLWNVGVTEQFAIFATWNSGGKFSFLPFLH